MGAQTWKLQREGASQIEVYCCGCNHHQEVWPAPDSRWLKPAELRKRARKIARQHARETGHTHVKVVKARYYKLYEHSGGGYR
jgi:hypothetical protein